MSLPDDGNKPLRFPVIRAIEISGYPMYPGNGGGLKHAFLPGINAIVGINGVGKTTLLNILLRVLMGPYDPRKADLLEPGAKLHELTELKRFGYFAARIGSDARSSFASVELSFGSERIRIVRDLGPKLEIKELWHNKTLLGHSDDLPYEQRYSELLTEVSGINSRYDFDFLVRNLLFFLEDKTPLIWNPKGQFEILRILFLDEALSAATAQAHDTVMQLDSRYRNQLWSLNRLRDEHTAALSSRAGATDDANTLAATRTAYDASVARSEELETEFHGLTVQVEEATARAFAAEQATNDVTRQLEEVEATSPHLQ